MIESSDLKPGAEFPETGLSIRKAGKRK